MNPPAQSPPDAPVRVWVWPAIVVGLLAAQLLASAVTLYLAVSDQSFAVVPDYYEKAGNWDREQAAAAANAALGWHPQLAIGGAAANGLGRNLALTLTNADSQPISGAAVDLVVFHHARAADRFHYQLKPVGLGRYEAVVPLRRPGLWEFSFDVQHGDQHGAFTKHETIGETAP